MALPLLVNGADCGPVNPLQGLSKQFDHDRGIQQDQFGAGRAGPSRETFRSQYTPSPGVNQDASRFFSDATARATPVFSGSFAYDLSALHTSLPPLQSPTFATPNTLQSAAAPWASDFLKQQPFQLAHPSAIPDLQAERQQGVHTPVLAGPQSPQQAVMQWTPTPITMGAGYAPPPLPVFGTQEPIHQQENLFQNHAMDWDKEFQSHEANLTATATEVNSEQALQDVQASSAIHIQDGDELARTAGLLVETVQHEENPKFKSSQFLGLMRQLRDRETVVEGNQMVKNMESLSWVSDFQASVSADVKGKRKAVESVRPILGSTIQPSGVSWASMAREALGKQAEEMRDLSEDPIDAYFRQENEDYMKYWQEQGNFPALADSVHGAVSTSRTINQTDEWDKLQRDWDAFEATSTGIQAVSHYQFQPNNPYLLGEASRTRHHVLHSLELSSMHESVLELEAVAQRDPTSSRAWYELGVKQQENEREQKAVLSLRRALELDPTHLPSWVALAVSHTNEGNRQGTYHAIRHWVEHNEKYQGVVQGLHIASELRDGLTWTEDFQHLAECLMAMARSDTSGTIDADIQVALAVLLNTSEEYDKARDCFLTALAVRPEDWLLYNRVGATLANSGQPDEALQYYYRALELNPAYIRARFNLGISCINLRRYDEAANHILDALVLQDSDGVVAAGDSLEDKRGITSSVLWDSLKTCCTHMQRIDLATLCDRRDLEAFRLNFSMP